MTAERAGLGSRLLAAVVDLLVQGATFAAVLSAYPKPSPAAVAVAGFLWYFGYFAAFEAFWNGQTPGKRLMGLRVVRDGGRPIDLAAAAIRNVVRIGEVALGFYAASAVACIASAQHKRFGDMAGGTIVVHDVSAPVPAIGAPAEPFRSPLLTAQEQNVIDRFNARRAGLDPQVRARLAARLAAQVRSRLSYDLQQLSDEQLLAQLSAS